MTDVLAALLAYAPIQRHHRDGTLSEEPGDTICRWCRIYANSDPETEHDKDCPITVAAAVKERLHVERLARALAEADDGRDSWDTWPDSDRYGYRVRAEDIATAYRAAALSPERA
jgi:hypothetical protein